MPAKPRKMLGLSYWSSNDLNIFFIVLVYATLTWHANSKASLAGYNVYMGTQSGVHRAPMAAGNTRTYMMGNLTGGLMYYFSVTGRNNKRK